MTNCLTIKNHASVPFQNIPVISYDEFSKWNLELLQSEHNHCVNYFGYGYPATNKLQIISCIADDQNHVIYISSTLVDKTQEIHSLTSLPSPSHQFNKDGEGSGVRLAFAKYEREIHENFGIKYIHHPWLKPVRYAYNRADKNQTLRNYPYYSMEGEELHEVGVGPIHAGVIEPGHFRFICNGEKILHMEVQLGFQHRGIETLMVEKQKLIQKTILAENIAGDTAVGHTVTFAQAYESLAGIEMDETTKITRTIALELERIAMHTADLGNISIGLAFLMGASVYGRLRTPIINFFLQWCGNRFAKGLIRVGTNAYPLTDELKNKLIQILDNYEKDFSEISKEFFSASSVLARIEKTGVVTHEQVSSFGAVGITARMSHLDRDIRSSHPANYYPKLDHHPILKNHGDIYSRLQLRKEEIIQSISYLRQMLSLLPSVPNPQPTSASGSTIRNPQSAIVLNCPAPNHFTLSLVEGWRGEICHTIITDENGKIKFYKIKDPSFHNWLALALSVREHEISDFPINNKSFNLSYCGNDL